MIPSISVPAHYVRMRARLVLSWTHSFPQIPGFCVVRWSPGTKIQLVESSSLTKSLDLLPGPVLHKEWAMFTLHCSLPAGLKWQTRCWGVIWDLVTKDVSLGMEEQPGRRSWTPTPWSHGILALEHSYPRRPKID